MLQVKQGQSDKMGLLFERHHRPLFGFFYHLCGSGDISEDLVQTVFYRMLRYRHTFTGEGFVTWMYHIARNVHADHYKKAQRHRINTQAEVEEVAADSTSDDDSSEHIGRLKRALHLLNHDKKEVLLMSRYQGLRYREIADILHCSEANVKVKVFRAMQELRKIFNHLAQKER